jgi:hypothetical protein
MASLATNIPGRVKKIRRPGSCTRCPASMNGCSAGPNRAQTSTPYRRAMRVAPAAEPAAPAAADAPEAHDPDTTA